MNFKDLEQVLRGDVIDWCMTRHLLQNKFSCRACRKPLSLISDTSNVDGKVWRCKNCRSKTSIRKDSLFFGSHLSIGTVLELLYWFSHRMPVTQASFECGVSESTGVDYYKIFRKIMIEVSLGGEKTGGEGCIVEIDEMKLGKRKFHRGKRVEGQWCFGGVLRRTNKDDPIHCFIVPVEDRSRKTLLPIIQQYIFDGTTIYSDCWKAYDCLNDEGFNHLNVNHSLHFKDPETGVHTNHIEGMWNQVKRSLPKFGTRKDLYGGHFAEFIVRNRYKKF